MIHAGDVGWVPIIFLIPDIESEVNYFVVETLNTHVEITEFSNNSQLTSFVATLQNDTALKCVIPLG